jgi:hypothetical protein
VLIDGVAVPGIVFGRGGAVGILVVLRCGGACGSGRVAVIRTPLERGDQGASNGAKIRHIGWLLTDLWRFENGSGKKEKKKEKMINCDKVVCPAVWQWLDGSVIGIVGKRRMGRVEWCENHQHLMGIDRVMEGCTLCCGRVWARGGRRDTRRAQVRG